MFHHYYGQLGNNYFSGFFSERNYLHAILLLLFYCPGNKNFYFIFHALTFLGFFSPFPARGMFQSDKTWGKDRRNQRIKSQIWVSLKTQTFLRVKEKKKEKKNLSFIDDSIRTPACNKASL